MDQYRIDFDAIEWQSPLPGARSKIFKQGNKQLRVVEFTKDFVEPDWCKRGHIGYILEGQMEIDFSGTKIVFDPGDGMFIPPGDEHKHLATVLTDKVRFVSVEDI